MIVLYIASFIVGLLIGVAVMLFGIERRPRADAAGAGVSLRGWIPLAAAFAMGFGVAGYSISRALSSAGALVASLAAGVVAAGLVRWLVAKSASMPVEHDVDDERYVLQGHVARVVSSIAAGHEGRISFDYGSEQRTLRARSLDDVAVAEGTEVVIERIEGDLAYVEPWLQVEQRL
jgi:membrane protein implicated in regulation of membrane protease activity